MSDLLIDLTPTTINRTAIYHIALDTALALRGEVAAYRYGTSYVDAPITSRPDLDQRAGPILRNILGADGLIRERWSGIYPKGRRKRDSARMLYFDPLYVLFEPIARQDIVLVLDLTPVTNPEWHAPHVCELYTVALQRVVASGARVAAISRSTAQALWANYGLSYTETTVVPLYLRGGIGAAAADAGAHRPSEKALLFVGSLETRKNIEGLCRAFEASQLSEEGWRLIIAGGDGNGADRIKSEAREVQGVDVRGFVSDEELRRLYRTSFAFVYPSYLEGFGVPILEAASWGLPILTSITGATAEVAPAGSLIVDPYDIREISQGLRSMAALDGSQRTSIAAVNREHATRYSFDHYMSVMKAMLFPA